MQHSLLAQRPSRPLAISTRTSRWRWLLPLLTLLLSGPGAWAQTVKTLPGDYANFTDAFNDINTNFPTGGVTVNVAANYTETPVAALPLITAQGTGGAAGQIIFQKAGTGANPRITAHTGSSSTTVDGIIRLSGADFVTFDGIDLVENASNTTAAMQMEFGYALFRPSPTNGCLNNIIRNCVVTLNKTNTATFAIYGGAGTSTAVTAVAATSAAGANSFNSFQANTLTNTYVGVYLNGSTITLANADTGNEVGTGSGNTISNIGGSSVATYGVRTEAQANLKIENNTISIPTGSTSTVRGIGTGISSNMLGTLLINANTISVAAATASTVWGINQGSTSSLSAVSITNNTIQNSALTGATGTVTYIEDAYNAIAGASTITGNQVLNNTAITTGVLTGIYRSGAGGTVNLSTNTVSGNTQTGANGTLYGIRATTGTITLNGNIIQNNGLPSTSGTTSSTNYGYYNFGSPVSETLTNNTITGLTIAGANTATAHALTGMHTNTSSSAVKAITGNTVGDLTLGTAAGTMAGTVNGINQFLGTTLTLSRNKIYGLTAFGATSVANGMLLNSGTTLNVNNNLIGDLRVPGGTSLLALSDVQITGGTTVNLFFNTLYLNATSTGATFGTTGIFLNSTTTTLDPRNNIVVNKSTAAGAGGFTATLRRNTGTAGTAPGNLAAATNNNIYFAGTPSATNVIYVEGTTTATNAQQTIAAYKTFVATRESNSVTEDVPFLSTSGGGATFLHINPAVATQAESGGMPISGITTDYDGDTRNATTPDIGADEGTFTPSDLSGPAIAFTSLSNTSSTANRTLTASITDPSGVSTTTMPRLFYRKGTTGAFISTPASSPSGSSYTFTFDYAALGGVAGGDVIQYYVVAQDNLGNVSSSPTGGTYTTAPSTVFQYTILNTLSGTYYVSATSATSPDPARTFATLTAAAAAYNTNGLAGPVTFLLLDPTYSTAETFPIAFNSNMDASATNTLLIKPSSATGTTSFTITGTTGTTASVGLIQLLGSDFVTLDGSLGNQLSPSDPRPSRDLTITNTSTTTTSAVIRQFAQFTNDGATNNTIRNLVAVGTATASVTGTLYGVALLGANNATTAGQYTNNTVQNVAVRNAQAGIASIGGTIALKNESAVITQNDLNAAIGAGALTRGGILLQFDNNAQVTQNTVGNITGTNDVVGISLGFGLVVSNSTFTGSEVTNALVSRNTIGRVTSTVSFSTVGIGVASAATGTTTVANNFVSGVAGNGSGGDFGAGIYVNGSAGGGATRVLFNSVSMTGVNPSANAASQPNFALAIGGSSPTVEVRNNVLYNAQTITGAQSYAIGFAYAGTTGTYAGLTSTNNAFFGTNGIGLTGSLVSGTVRATLADLNAETGQDRPTTAMPAGTSLTLSGSPFVSTTDLHTLAASLNGKATSISGVTTDIDGDVRDASNPDIGADEFAPPATLDLKPVSLLTPSATQTCFTATEPVSVQLSNNGGANIDFATTNGTVTVVVTPPSGAANNQTFTITLATGTLASGATQNVTLPGTLDMTPLGAYSFAISASVPGDILTTDNIVATRTNSVPQAALPYSEPFNTSTLPANFTTTGFTTSTSANNGGAAGSFGLRVNIYSSVATASATTPILGTTVSSNNVLTFDARFTNFFDGSGTVLSANDRMDVQVAVCSGSFATVYTINGANQNGTGAASTSFFNYAVPLTGVTAGQKVQVRLVATYGGTSGSDFNVDLDNLNVQSFVNTDLSATALLAPTTTQGCYGAAETVTVTVKNVGDTTLDFAANPGTVTVNVTGVAPATLTATIASGTLAAGATQNVMLTPTLNMSAYGAYTFAVGATVTGDQNAANDNLAPVPTITTAAPVAGTLASSVGSFCASGSSTLSLSGAANGAAVVQVSTDNLTFTDIAGATLPYATGTLTQTTYYRVQVRCAPATATSNVVTILKTLPTQAVASPTTACQGAPFTISVTGTGGSGAVSGTRTESPALAIPDNSAAVGVSSQLTLSGAAGATLSAASSVRVTLNLTHTFDGDLDIFLVSPDGTKAMLLSSDNGSSGDNYTNTVLLTGASPSITTGSAPFTGTFAPEGGIATPPDRTGASSVGGVPSGTYSAVIPAAALDGSPINGTWTLRVFDDASGDVGTLNSWSLSISDPGIAPVYTHTVTGPGTVSAVTYSGANNATGTVTVTGAPVGSNTYTLGTAASGNSSCMASSTSTVAVSPAATANAGTAPAGVCGSTYSTTGSYGGSATSATYTSSGTGTFSNGGVIDGTTPSVTYTPSAADITAGSVTLTLTTSGPCAAATATLPLAINLTTYTGAAPADGSNWFNAANWTACVPSSTVDAVIPAGLTNYPNLSTTATAAVRTLTIANGARLTQSAGTLDVYGDLTSSTPVANVSLTGGVVAFLSAMPTITGSLALYDLTANLSTTGGVLTLSTPATVNHTLTMTQGVLNTNANALTLGATATLVESDASYVLGQVVVPNRNLATATAEAFGDIGLTLTPDASSQAFPGLTTVVRTTGTALTGASTSVSIKRYFDIQPATNTGLNVAMNFSYFDHERNGIAAANVALFKSVSGTSGPWANQSPISIAGNTVTKLGIADFSIWTLGNGVAAPLPVELTAFAATRQGADALLTWTTASEKDNRGFEVQVSTDGRTFRELGVVAGAGSSSAPRSYTFTDREGGKNGLRYYRLRQVDFNGTATFSPVRAVNFTAVEQVGLSAVPVPFGNEFTLLLQARTAAPATVLTLTDAAGRTVGKRVVGVLAGTNRLPVTGLEGLPSGLYMVQLTIDGQLRHLKVVKQ